jgi:hypothetical protein
VKPNGSISIKLFTGTHTAKVVEYQKDEKNAMSAKLALGGCAI